MQEWRLGILYGGSRLINVQTAATVAMTTGSHVLNKREKRKQVPAHPLNVISLVLRKANLHSVDAPEPNKLKQIMPTLERDW